MWFWRACFVAVAFWTVSGCAHKEQVDSEPIDVGEAPVCSSDGECRAMWARAAQVLPIITGMKLRIMNDIFMETFVPVRGIPMTASAVKEPRGDGTTVIRANIGCRYQGACGNLPQVSLKRFNSSVSSAGTLYRLNEPVKK